jgi:hypothetical protein
VIWNIYTIFVIQNTITNLKFQKTGIAFVGILGDLQLRMIVEAHKFVMENVLGFW